MTEKNQESLFPSIIYSPSKQLCATIQVSRLMPKSMAAQSYDPEEDAKLMDPDDLDVELLFSFYRVIGNNTIDYHNKLNFFAFAQHSDWYKMIDLCFQRAKDQLETNAFSFRSSFLRTEAFRLYFRSETELMLKKPDASPFGLQLTRYSMNAILVNATRYPTYTTIHSPVRRHKPQHREENEQQQQESSFTPIDQKDQKDEKGHQVILIVPNQAPHTNARIYSTLGKFMDHAPSEQKMVFWKLLLDTCIRLTKNLKIVRWVYDVDQIHWTHLTIEQ
jgi:hypothetical protein